MPFNSNSFINNNTGIEFYGNANSSILKNTFNDNIDYSISAVQNMSNGTFDVLNNSFENPYSHNSMAIYIDIIDKDVVVENNTINQLAGSISNIGITVHGNNLAHIENNTIDNINDGIEVQGYPTTITHNIITTSVTGILVNSNSAVISENIITTCDRGIQVTSNSAVITKNEIYNSSSYGIYSFLSNTQIINNIIDNTANPNIGCGITCKQSSNVNIDQNNITKYNQSIYVSDNSNDISMENNQILDCNNGIAVNNYCSNITIDNNSLTINGVLGIHSSYTDNFSIKNNNITFIGSNLSKIGIITDNSLGNNDLYHNMINMGGVTSGSEEYCTGIQLSNNPRTDILNNQISNTGLGISFASDNNNGVIGCNVIDGAYRGFQLYNAIWGESFLSSPYTYSFKIGETNNPYNNYWYNISTSMRVYGAVYPYSYYQFYFFYANTNYENLLSMSFYSVTGNFHSYQTNDANFCNIPPIPPPSNSSSLNSSIAKSNYRDKYIGFAIDTSYIFISNLLGPNNNPQGIYNDNIRYNLVKNAYYHYLSMPIIQYLGVFSDSLYSTFKQQVETSNIGRIYDIDKAIKQKNYTLANSLLQNYQPINLPEFNTHQAYGIYISYLITDSLSSLDSIALNSIAYQNPAIGGYDVFLARNLLNLYLFDPFIQINSKARIAKPLNEENEYSNNDTFIKIFPNPTQNELYISRTNPDNLLSNYSIFSIDGKLVMQGNLQNKSNTVIDISKLQSGLYYINIIENGIITTKEKFIKK